MTTARADSAGRSLEAIHREVAPDSAAALAGLLPPALHRERRPADHLVAPAASPASVGLPRTVKPRFLLRGILCRWRCRSSEKVSSTYFRHRLLGAFFR